MMSAACAPALMRTTAAPLKRIFLIMRVTPHAVVHRIIARENPRGQQNRETCECFLPKV
jgi:hypothetical protein